DDFHVLIGLILDALDRVQKQGRPVAGRNDSADKRRVRKCSSRPLGSCERFSHLPAPPCRPTRLPRAGSGEMRPGNACALRECAGNPALATKPTAPTRRGNDSRETPAYIGMMYQIRKSPCSGPSL